MSEHKKSTNSFTLEIEGMSCHSCSKTIEASLKRVPGVDSAIVNFATGTATVHSKDEIPVRTLIKAVENTGYSAMEKGHHNASHSEENHLHHGGGSRNHLIILLTCVALTLPFLFHMIGMFTGSHDALSPTLQLILATLVQIIGGWTFYRASYFSLKNGSANMDVLIALGTSAAYAMSVAAWFKGGEWPLYFETSAMIITLVLFGRWLEALSKEKASDAIGKLIAIQPNEASVERNGAVQSIPVAEIVKGDILHVKAGERIAVDGIVIKGDSEIDASVVTGESVPVVAREGIKVLAGTLNLNGALVIRAEGVGAETVLSAMIRMVERAQQTKPPVERLADKVSSIFVPAVLVIAFLTFAGWLVAGAPMETAVINAVSVLVIACPCALGLATPIVIIVAGGRGAESGILFKEASSIERTHDLNVLFFDKTGTLTEGKPYITDIIASAGITQEQVLTAAASLEKHVEHPLAKAVINEAEARSLKTHPVTDFRAIAGKGAIGMIGSEQVGIGAIRYAKDQNIAIDETVLVPLENQGKSIIVVWKSGKLLGYIGASDRLRDNAAATVAKLKALHVQSVMLTGDNATTAARVAKDAGIESFYAALLPQDKLNAIEAAKGEGNITGMIGDGINDAPALAAADVGFALGASTDVAMEAASIALMRNDLLSVVEAIALSKEAFRKIKQNLFFAFIYNIIGIPLAALGLLNPIFAAAAMAMSSLSVVFNALLLKHWRR